MHRFPLPTLLRAAVLAAILIAAAAAALVSRAAANEQGSAWSAPAGVDPCGSEIALEQQLLRDPALRARLEEFEVLAREAERAASACFNTDSLTASNVRASSTSFRDAMPRCSNPSLRSAAILAFSTLARACATLASA